MPSFSPFPPRGAPLLLPELPRQRLPRHRQRAFQAQAAARTSATVLGIVNGTAEWLFAFPDRLSATISAADRWIETPREDARARGFGTTSPSSLGARGACRHGTSSRSAAPLLLRCPKRTASGRKAATTWRNLFLAGDWTATGLPATIEGAIRSGNDAARSRARRPRRINAREARRDETLQRPREATRSSSMRRSTGRRWRFGRCNARMGISSSSSRPTPPSPPNMC